jgi:hypothetical protein
MSERTTDQRPGQRPGQSVASMTGDTRDFAIVTPGEYADWYFSNEKALRLNSPFHHPSWLLAVSRALRSEQLPVRISDGDQVVGMVPGFRSGFGPARIWGSPLKGMMTSYLGLTGTGIPEDPGELLELNRAAADFLRREHRFLYARSTLRNSPPNGKPDLGPSWEQQRPKSYRLDLTGGEEAVWDNLTSDCRRNVRKAIKQGVEVAPLDDPDVFYAMLDETLRRHGSTSSHPPRFFHSLFEELGPLLKARSAVYQGQVIAAGLFLCNGQELHYLSGASDPAFGSFPTSYLLHWNAISEGIEDGVAVFNSDASRIRSIDRFKESFRPELEQRHTIVGAPPLVYWAQKKLISGYRGYRRARARLSSGS